MDEPTANPVPLEASAQMMAGLSADPAPVPGYVPAATPAAPSEPPSKKKNSSWGVIIFIFLMLGLMVIGAFYAWGKRISQDRPSQASILLISPAARV